MYTYLSYSLGVVAMMMTFIIVLSESFMQIRVLKDMLSFEKQKADDAEAQFRHQKKILAKEIKSLRAEVLARQSERDSYRDELQILRRSLSSYRR